MKSQRRHELEQNELANWLGGVIQAIRPYQNAIFAMVLLAAVGTLAYGWITRRAAQTDTHGWDSFYQAAGQEGYRPAVFDDLAERYPDRQVGHWAAALAGDLHLAAGCQQLFIDKAAARQELKQAIDQYRGVRQRSDDPLLLERAAFGLARAYEAQGDSRSLEEAQRYYQQVVEKWPEGAYAEMAGRRLKDLSRPSTKAFYDRFAQYDPKPADFLDEPGVPGERPSFDLDSLPDDGLEGLPNDASLFEPQIDLGVEEESPQSAPAEETSPELPAEAPGDATPAESGSQRAEE